MTPSPFFTILTASMNCSNTLSKTIQSITAQTFDDVEHIIIDGGSEDGTLKVLKIFESAYDMKWISESDTGISEALTKGIRLSRGSYILVLHADDRLLNNRVLLRSFRQLKNESVGICSHPVLKESPAGGLRPYRPVPIRWWHRFKTIFPHQGCFVHRRIFERIGGFREDLKIAIDYDFFYRALNEKPSVRFCSDPIAVMGGAGISSNPKLVSQRIDEEFAVQRRNESAAFWRILQILFRSVYRPYKVRLQPALGKARTRGLRR